jgi:hypothetical protein
MANGFMNPFGTQTAIPSLFGEDPASQEAREAQKDAAQSLIRGAGNVTANTLGLIGDVPAAAINPFLKPESQYGTQFGEGPKVPALGSQQFKNIFNISKDAAKIAADTMISGADSLGFETDGSKILNNLLNQSNDQTNVPTNKMLDQNMTSEKPSDPSATSRPKSPIEIHTEYLQFLKEQGVSDDERAKIAGQMLKPFLSEPTQTAQRGAGVDPRDEESSYERELRRKQEEQDEVNRKQKYRSMARKMYGAKGGGVDIMAERLMAEDDAKRAQEERAAAESEASIAASEALTEKRLAPEASAYDKAESLVDRLISEGRISPSEKDIFLLRALRLEKSAGGDFAAIEELLKGTDSTSNDEIENDLATVTLIDGQPV